MLNSSLYTLNLIGLILELAGVIGLSSSAQKWIMTIKTTKSFMPYAEPPAKNDYLSQAVQMLPIDKTQEETSKELHSKINETDKKNSRLRKVSLIWLIIVVLGSLTQIIATYYFREHSLNSNT